MSEDSIFFDLLSVNGVKQVTYESSNCIIVHTDYFPNGLPFIVKNRKGMYDVIPVYEIITPGESFYSHIGSNNDKARAMYLSVSITLLNMTRFPQEYVFWLETRTFSTKPVYYDSFGNLVTLLEIENAMKKYDEVN